MKLVKQRTDVDCGVAVAAMLIGCSYRRARALVPAHAARNGRGLWVRELQAILLDTTGTAWKSFDPKPHKPLRTFQALLEGLDGPVALVLKSPGVFNAHWIVVNAGLVYDPNHVRVRPLGSYPRRHWPLLRIVAPAETLAQARRRG